MNNSTDQIRSVAFLIVLLNFHALIDDWFLWIFLRKGAFEFSNIPAVPTLSDVILQIFEWIY